MDKKLIHEELIKFGSFPKGERDQCYQEYYLDGEWHEGEREIRNRMKIMNFFPQKGDIVADIGCNIGGFLQESYLNGATCIGFDIDSDYVRIAKQLAEYNGHEITFINNKTIDECIKYLKNYDKIDYLLLMSMGKHIGEETLFKIINTLKPKTVFIETNAFKKDPPYLDNITKLNGSIIGKTYDRNERVLYKICFN